MPEHAALSRRVMTVTPTSAGKRTRRRDPAIDHELGLGVIARVPWLRERLLAWFASHRWVFPWREPGRLAYDLIVAEVLLQRTMAAKVAGIYSAFIGRYPSWDALARAKPGDLQESLRPLGLWQQKTEVLQSLAGVMASSGGSVPASRDALQTLPGVGQYIANAVLLVLHGKPEPLLDVNMARVLERVFGTRTSADIRDDPYLQTLSRRVVAGDRSLELNWAILDLGALVCRAGRPQCDDCPLQVGCDYHERAARRSRSAEAPSAVVSPDG